jgi:P-aminobenzoate N-oxygenase AurF
MTGSDRPYRAPGELVASAVVTTRIGWGSDGGDDRLGRLYGNASAGLWTEDDIDWALARPLDEMRYAPAPRRSGPPGDSPFADGDAGRWDAFRRELHAWLISQILYGEQGALVITARLAEVLPGTAAKCVAASQASDEARHVRVFQRYLDLVGHAHPPSAELGDLLALLLSDARWDLLFLGMQVILEGVALAVVRFADVLFGDPLLASIARRVARDEARHLGFGVVSLQARLREMTAAERAERTDFIAEAVTLMSRRFLFDGVWERLGVGLEQGRRYARREPDVVTLRRLLFTYVMGALRRLGLWGEIEPVFSKLGLAKEVTTR